MSPKCRVRGTVRSPPGSVKTFAARLRLPAAAATPAASSGGHVSKAARTRRRRHARVQRARRDRVEVVDHPSEQLQVEGVHAREPRAGAERRRVESGEDPAPISSCSRTPSRTAGTERRCRGPRRIAHGGPRRSRRTSAGTHVPARVRRNPSRSGTVPTIHPPTDTSATPPTSQVEHRPTTAAPMRPAGLDTTDCVSYRPPESAPRTPDKPRRSGAAETWRCARTHGPPLRRPSAGAGDLASRAPRIDDGRRDHRHEAERHGRDGPLGGVTESQSIRRPATLPVHAARAGGA